MRIFVRRTHHDLEEAGMNSDFDGLQARLNQAVQLRFRDVEMVEAKLLGIDPARDRDLTYEVLRVLHRAAPAARGTAVGATVIAQLEDLESWEPLS
jgi:carbamoylphosphate synthase large subunit